MTLRLLFSPMILLLVSCQSVELTDSDARLVTQANICQQYDWGKVELLVSPHLDDFLMTALVMQGQSANYNTSAAASQVREDIKDPQVVEILDKIIAANCE